MYTVSLPGMDIYITSNLNTKVLVEISARGVIIGTLEVKARQIMVVPEITRDVYLGKEGISKKGIQILAEHPVVVYAQIYTALATGEVCAFLSVPLATSMGRR